MLRPSSSPTDGVRLRRALARGHPYMVFDWDLAAQLILRSEVPDATAGLEGCWEDTGGYILRNFQPMLDRDGDNYTYLASYVARPMLALGAADPVPCYYTIPREGATGREHLARVKWPDPALAILTRRFPGAG